jgi:hypothetical protein
VSVVRRDDEHAVRFLRLHLLDCSLWFLLPLCEAEDSLYLQRTCRRRRLTQVQEKLFTFRSVTFEKHQPLEFRHYVLR